MKKKKLIGFGIIGVIIAFILYKLWQYNRSKNCWIMEEVHEQENQAGDDLTWFSFIKFDADGNRLRPPAEAFTEGGTFRVMNTESALNGTYTIYSIFYDSNGDIGSLRAATPPNYNFSYTAEQSGDPRDDTYFGIGKICK